MSTQQSPVPQPTPTQQAKYLYLTWVDYAKGIGITLMVLGHVILGLSRSDLLPPDHWLLVLNEWIYAFHMPLFFFLSGLFVQSSFRKSKQRFLAQRLQRIVYPYFLWSLLQGGLKLVLPQHANDSVGVGNLIKIIHTPLDQFWFLYVLFLLSLLYAIFAYFSFASAAFLGATVLLSSIYIAQLPLGSWGVVYMVSRHAFIFALGVYFGAKKTSELQTLKLPALIAIAGLAATILTGGVALNLSGLLESRLSNYLLDASGVLMTICVSMVLAKLHRLGRLVVFGRYSLQIYLAHVLFIAAVRAFVIKVFGYSDVYLHTIIGLLIGIYLPIWLQQLYTKCNFKYLFAWGA